MEEGIGRIRHSVKKVDVLPGVSSCGYPVKYTELSDEKSPWPMVSCWPDVWLQEHMTSATG